MPRRRIRTRIEREVAENLGDAYKFTRNPQLEAARAEERRRRRLERPALRFVQCAIRGCREKVVEDPTEALPVCIDHAIDIWEIVETRDQHPYLRETLSASIAERDRIRAENRAIEKAENRRWVNSGDAMGDIYFCQVNDLIKVGWTSDLFQRIRGYGPQAVVLAHYEAPRRDEATLHQQLKPALSEGREWYRDCDIVRAFIERAIAEHGEPEFTRIRWTKSRSGTVKPKGWR